MWILILSLTYGTGTSATSPEFTSQKACEAAIATVEKSFSGFSAPHIDAVCVPKDAR